MHSHVLRFFFRRDPVEITTLLPEGEVLDILRSAARSEWRVRELMRDMRRVPRLRNRRKMPLWRRGRVIGRTVTVSYAVPLVDNPWAPILKLRARTQIDGTVVLKGYLGDRQRAVATTLVLMGMSMVLAAVVLAGAIQGLTEPSTSLSDIGGLALWAIVLLAFPVAVIGVGRAGSRSQGEMHRAWIDDVVTQLDATTVRLPGETSLPA